MAQLQPSSSFSYDVFLSFKGADTRFGFTGNLHKALCDNGIHTFIDDMDLHRGEEITPSLIKAIEESRITIPVFSINYASSSFCLDELVHIVDCFKTNSRLVLPVFYGVDPSQVRHQTHSYGAAISKHEMRFQNNKKNMERLQNWKRALNQAATLSGYHFNLGNEYEHNFIRKIVSDVSNKINCDTLYVVDYPVGLQSRVVEVKSLLDMVYDSRVHMVGIHGIGGMGKSTLARAIYNSIADKFECVCFLHNIRENSAKHGLQHLQEELLSKSVGFHFKLRDVSEGIPIIKKRLGQKKVLLILDDVDNRKQIQVLAGGLDWFGPGSRIIITTRDINLLESHMIERNYEVGALNVKESLKLLRWKAFKDNIVDSSYEHLLNRGVRYASGLPLALEVLGSNLYGKKNIEEWKSTLDQYERIPHKEIQNILKVSFDNLEEEEKSVFLDIACCFKGYKLQELKNILQAHYEICMEYHIRVLAEKSLIKISQISQHNHTSYVTLHDLIEVMGKEIVRQESLKDPGKRSRLWFHEDIVQVLQENMGTSQIEIIHMDYPFSQEQKVVEWKGDELKKMKNLKTLIIKNSNFSKGFELLPDDLRVLEWHRYPSCDMPFDICANKLSIIKLQKSDLTSFGLHGSSKKFMNLRELNLNSCQYLTHILDVSSLQNLEILSFCDCENLLTLHNSIGFLNKLKILDATDCYKLKSFPPMKITSLENLNISYCKTLKNFPEILVEMKNITYIFLTDTSIEEIPSSFENLTGLTSFTVWGRGMLRVPSKILMMQSLSYISVSGCLLIPNLNLNQNLSSMVSSNVRHLRLSRCNISDEFLQKILTQFPNMIDLDLSSNNLTIIPECIKECRFLTRLSLDDCKYLREIRSIPPKLNYLSASGCESLTSWSKNMLWIEELHEVVLFIVPTKNVRIPKWFEHQSRGPSISFWFCNKLPYVALFIAAKHCPNKESYSVRINIFINGYNLCTLRSLWIEPDHARIFDLQLHDRLLELEFSSTRDAYRELNSKLDEALLKNEWIHVEIMFKNVRMETLRIKSGIHVYKQKNSIEDNIRFNNPYKKRKFNEVFLSDSPPEFHLLNKRARFVDEVLESKFLQKQFCIRLDRVASLFLPFNFSFLLFAFYFVILFWRIPYLLIFL